MEAALSILSFLLVAAIVLAVGFMAGRADVKLSDEHQRGHRCVAAHPETP